MIVFGDQTSQGWYDGVSEDWIRGVGNPSLSGRRSQAMIQTSPLVLLSSLDMHPECPTML